MKINTQYCIRKGVYRVEKNNFTMMYMNGEDVLLLGVTNWDKLSYEDIKDINEISNKLLKIIEREAKDEEV